MNVFNYIQHIIEHTELQLRVQFIFQLSFIFFYIFIIKYFGKPYNQGSFILFFVQYVKIKIQKGFTAGIFFFEILYSFIQFICSIHISLGLPLLLFFPFLSIYANISSAVNSQFSQAAFSIFCFYNSCKYIKTD